MDAVRRDLEAAGRSETVLGHQALALATAIEAPSTSGAGVAALNRELRTVMGEALKDASAADDRLDELARRRALKAGA